MAEKARLLAKTQGEVQAAKDRQAAAALAVEKAEAERQRVEDEKAALEAQREEDERRTAAAKQAALEAVGVKVGKTPSETAQLMRDILNKIKG
mgnify:CR=1 FL=1